MSTTNQRNYKTEEGPGYSMKLFFDERNHRLRVIRFQAQDYDKLVEKLLVTAKNSGLSKIWLVCSSGDWIKFLEHGFVVEGAAEGYLRGDTGFFMSYFFEGGRQLSKAYGEEQEILKKVLATDPEATIETTLPQGYLLRKANTADVLPLANLFGMVFETYPVPVTNQAYLKKVMETNTVFYLVEHNGKIISTASADIDVDFGNAELTDCATLPDYRGQGLMASLIRALEEELKNKKIFCLYSLARAKSPGIGKVFRKLGYQYRGRLINNCSICGAFEDMNLWVKYVNGTT